MPRYHCFNELGEAVLRGLVRMRQHPTLPLDMYTYTEKCVYSGEWDETTRRARGLILERETDTVVAWPFPKFFNHHDHVNQAKGVGPLPTGPFEVFDKIDGSLGIVFHYAGSWHVCTKGSFVSDQAVWAQAWLDRHHTDVLLPGTTYLAEITYAENRIVCRIEGPGTMTLLGAYNATGDEVPLDMARGEWEAMGAPVVGSYEASSLEDIVEAAAENRHFLMDGNLPLTGAMAEGWVVRYFRCGTRVKIKLEDYVRLHGTLTRTNAHTIWEALSSGSDPADVLVSVPDEFADWVRDKSAELRKRQWGWVRAASWEFGSMQHLIRDRKAFAKVAITSPYRAALFRLLDGKLINELAWKAIEPQATDADYLPPSMRSENPEHSPVNGVE